MSHFLYVIQRKKEGEKESREELILLLWQTLIHHLFVQILFCVFHRFCVCYRFYVCCMFYVCYMFYVYHPYYASYYVYHRYFVSYYVFHPCYASYCAFFAQRVQTLSIYTIPTYYSKQSTFHILLLLERVFVSPVQS